MNEFLRLITIALISGEVFGLIVMAIKLGVILGLREYFSKTNIIIHYKDK